jgi:hypothetical protein
MKSCASTNGKWETGNEKFKTGNWKKVTATGFLLLISCFLFSIFLLVCDPGPGGGQ